MYMLLLKRVSPGKMPPYVVCEGAESFVFPQNTGTRTRANKYAARAVCLLMRYIARQKEDLLDSHARARLTNSPGFVQKIVGRLDALSLSGIA